MKKIYYLILFITIYTLSTYAQGWMNNWNSDYYDTVKVSGTAIVDSNFYMPHYFLDTNNDGTPDYMLNFGPYWYEPDSSSAVRPANGDQITIMGALFDQSQQQYQMIMVYEINGNLWRDAFDSYWNNMGTYSHMGGMHMGNFNGYAFGWMHDSLETVNLNGKVLTDTNFFFNHYYLDVNNDSIPDYMLNFGPPWYEPESGAVRPLNGQEVSIKGGMLSNDYTQMIIVYEINGEAWRDSTYFNQHFAGRWISKNNNDTSFVHSPFDMNDWMGFSPGWHGGGGMGGGMMMPDSLFAQMFEVFPEGMPDVGNQNAFAGFEVGMFFPNGRNGMFGNGMNSMMKFNSNIKLQFHYTKDQLSNLGLDENTLKVKLYDTQTGSWQQVNDVSINTNDGTVSFSQSQLGGYYILSAEQVTAVKNDKQNIPGTFQMKQNYPNPFNPSTTIEYSLPVKTNVEIAVFNLLGQKVATLVNKVVGAGIHKVNFDAGSLSTGIYFCRISTPQFTKVMKMELLK